MVVDDPSDLMNDLKNKINKDVAFTINSQMTNPFKEMRVIFQIKEIKVNLPQHVKNCDLGVEFQIKACNPKELLLN